MGANMMLVTAAAPHLADDSALPADDAERLRILEQIGVTRVHKVPESKIIAVLESCEIEFAGNQAVIDGLNGDPEADVTDEMIRSAREGLARFHPFRNRTVCELKFGERTYFATGGLSYGDTPIEAYDSVLLLDEVNLWDAPVTAAEVTAARAVLDAESQ